MTNADSSGAVADSNVGNLKRGYLANSEPGLKHQLGKRIVTRGQTVARCSGRPKQRVNLDIIETGRLAVAYHAHWSNVADKITRHGTGSARPPKKPSQGLPYPHLERCNFIIMLA